MNLNHSSDQQAGAALAVMPTSRADMCYCPGCTHASVLEQIGAAIDRLGIPPEGACIVTDIGCIGTADRYFNCHTFHGLHGRSITYAEGIKRARPDLLVVVLIGDGGCGIGAAHLIHAARRGADIKVIVCNNFNFGMTGGQHSPTTPEAGVTCTTPSGATDAPFDICQTVIVNGAAHVGRYSALDNECPARIEAALRAPGFALLDLWELCVAYFVPMNKLKPSGLHELSTRLDLPMGRLHEHRPTELDHTPAEPARPRVPARTESTPMNRPRAVGLDWPGRVEICLAGSAGQHVRSAAGVLGEIAVAAGLFAAQQDDFPITVRKGHSISRLIISPEPIRYTGVDHPNLVVILSEDGLARLGNLDILESSCLLLAERELALPASSSDARPFDLDHVRQCVGRASTALCALVQGLLQGGWIGPIQFVAAADAALDDQYRDQNLRAIRAGVERVFAEK